MNNAEWMVKNGYDFMRLDIKRKSGKEYNITFDDKVISTIMTSETVTNALLSWFDMKHHKEPILDDAEKRYLKGVIRPFRNDVQYIVKISNTPYAFIRIDLRYESVNLPYFEMEKMYKGMKPDREYTLKELGL